MLRTRYGPANSTVEVPAAFVKLGTADVERVKQMVRTDPDVVLEHRMEWTDFFDRMIAK